MTATGHYKSPGSHKYSPQDIKESTEILDYINSCGIKLRKSGNRYTSLCPFPDHDDRKTKSFTVYPETQSFHCFGCRRGGDIYEFIQVFKNISFSEALKEVAAYAGISLEDLSHKHNEDGQYNKSKTTGDILTSA